MNVKRIYDPLLAPSDTERKKLTKPLAEYFANPPASGPGGVAVAAAAGLPLPAKPPGLPGVPPGIPGSPPGAPGAPAVPGIPGLPPGVPGIPGAPGPGIPGAPGPGLAAAAASGGAPVKHGTQSKKIYTDSMYDYIATWFFQGPGTLKDGFSFQSFFQNADLIFQKKGSVFVSFAEVATSV